MSPCCHKTDRQSVQACPLMRAKRVESRCGAVALGGTYLLPPLSSGGALVVPPWLRFHIPLIEPDRRICRVAQPLLAFAPTEPTVRRYRSGLFRKDLRRVDSGPPRSHARGLAARVASAVSGPSP